MRTRTVHLLGALLCVAIITLGCQPPAAADVDAHDIAAAHQRHGHDQYRNGTGDRGHRWSDYQREARQVNAYLERLALNRLVACSRDPHCAVKLASYLTGAPYRLVDAVVRCESGYNPGASNPSSSAGGLGQWLASSWASHAPAWGMAGHSRYEVWPAALVTAGVISQGGIGNWAASRSCWG